jgi:L-ascorbate metabolism protein UlaG (beta-lactamase superfamily)
MEKDRQAGAETTLHWFGHASFRMRHKGTVIYIDPWKLREEPQDATIVLVSHGHQDHYSPQDIVRVKGYQTELVASADVIEEEGGGHVLVPGLTVTIGAVKITGVPAYNPAKRFHPKGSGWVGFVIELGGKRIYYAGDTDLLEEMKTLGKIDVAMLPIGGTYTMDAEEAAQAANSIRPELAIPYHWGDIVGGRDDAEKFAKLCHCAVKVLHEGQTIVLDREEPIKS